MIWEVQCLEHQKPITRILGIRILKDFLDLLFSRAHILRTLFNIHADEGSCLDGAQQKKLRLKVLLVLLLYCINAVFLY